MEERLRQLFAVNYGRNGIFLRIFLQNNGILQRQNDETAKEERQRNGGNRAQVSLTPHHSDCVRNFTHVYVRERV